MSALQPALQTALHPALFLGHGSPMQAIEPSRFTAAWTRLGTELPRPQAVVAVSAHWYTRGTAVTVQQRPRTIHDFYGFPPALHAVEYPAPGAPALARRVAELLRPTAVTLDESWGLDHGSWSVLRYLFPDASVPVIQLSIDGTLPPQQHYDLGRRLAPLRAEGVLLLGSGNVVHNLRTVRFEAGIPPEPWAVAFSDAVRDAALGGRHQALIDYPSLSPHAAMSVPTAEHYLPLLYVLGALQPGEAVSVPVDGIDLSTIGMLCLQVGSQSAAHRQ